MDAKQVDRCAVIRANGVIPTLEKYLMRRRQQLIMEIGEIEDLLGLQRSITPRRKRERE